jgi:diaminopimelate epimerase
VEHSHPTQSSSRVARWFKGHGLGNDYLAVDSKELGIDLTPPVVRLVCDRHHGIGADGILLAVEPVDAPFALRIFNPDGSEAEKSGNGLRIFAAYLFEMEAVRARIPFSVETNAGTVRIEIVEEEDDGVLMVEVEMGVASFRSAAVGLRGPDREVDGELLELDGGDRVAIHTVSMGNPHCVCFEDEIIIEDVRRRGPQIATHPWFANGTNVQFATVTPTGEIRAYVWERGAGETLASGSSACAVAAAAVRRGLVQDRLVKVSMPGGSLLVSVGEAWDVLLRGAVESIGWIEFAAGFQRRIEMLS